MKFHGGTEVSERYSIRKSVLFTLLKYVFPYKWVVIIALAQLSLNSVFQLAGPYLVKSAIDGPIANSDLPGLIRITLMYLGTIIGSFLLMFGQIYIMSWTGQKVMYDMRVRLFAHIQTLNLRFFDKTPVGVLMTRLTSDIETLSELVSSGVVQMIGDLLTLSGILIILFFLSVRLSLISLVGLAVLIIVTLYFRPRFRHSFRMVREKVAAMNAYLQEAISGIHVIQLFNNHYRSQTRFNEANEGTLNAHLLTVKYFSLFVPFIELANAVSIVLILIYGGILVPDKTITIGVLVAFFQYAQLFFHPIRDLSQKYNILQSAMAASERVFKILDTDESVPEPENPVHLDSVKGEIEFEGVWFAYQGEEYVLKDVSFTIKPGERVAIVGATGAGKSTITSLICRFYDPQKGTIRLDGIDIRDIPTQELLCNIGLVHQEAFIFSGTVIDNILLGRNGQLHEKIETMVHQIGLGGFVDKLPDGLNQQVGERGNRFSAGERQLIAFARAVSYEPKILILDEATSNVDTETEMIIQDATEKISHNRTSLLIAHRLSTIRMADRILVFHKGQLREQGTHHSLIEQNGIYSRLTQLYFNSGT
jgi:ATP-binding cassette, subfamily B, multidrug efflux pump